MKNMKKLFSLVLALVMMMALVVTAGAAENPGDITIQNAEVGKEYKAYKIFGLSYNETKTAFSYTIDKDSPWKDTVAQFFDLTASTSDPSVLVATVKKVTNSEGEEVEGTLDAAAFAAALNVALKGDADKNISASVTTATVAASGTAVEGVQLVLHAKDLGYYFVTSGLGSLCNLTNTDPTATIYDKNDKPTITKKTKDEIKSAYVGQVVPFIIEGEIPSTTGYANYEYTITDTMTEGLTFNGIDYVSNEVEGASFKVTIAGIDDDEVATYITTKQVVGNGFKLTIDVDNEELQKHVGAKITVTYSATLNDKGVGVTSKNDAKLTYSNDPANGGTGEFDHPDVNVYSSKISIIKHKTGDEKTTLSGAKFVLAKGSVGSDGVFTATGYYKYTAATVDASAKVEWVNRIYKTVDNGDGTTTKVEDATVKTTNDNGEETFVGLEDGTYYLIEIEAPKGYNLLTNPVKVEIKDESEGSTEGNPVVNTLNYETKVANSTGTELPATGGIGTTIFTVTGAILMIGAAVLFLTKKRTEA